MILALTTSLVLACGDDDGNADTPDASANAADADPSAADAMPGPDAEPLPACAEDLGTQDDGSSATVTDPNIVVSEVDPGEFIEVYNAGDETVALNATGYFWCNKLSYHAFASHNITIKSGGRRTIPWPGGGGTDSGGDVSIYLMGQFTGGANNIMDYVCWGNPGGSSRLSDAEGVEKWNGNCVDAIPAGGTLVRRQNRAGAQASDYEVQNTPDPEDCQ